MENKKAPAIIKFIGDPLKYRDIFLQMLRNHILQLVIYMKGISWSTTRVLEMPFMLSVMTA